jgi:hypothetical protein
MDRLKDQKAITVAQFLLCAVAVPTFVLAGLLLKGAILPSTSVTGEFAGWMVIFVLFIFFPAHLVALTITYLLARNRFVFRWPAATILAACALAALTIALSSSGSPFSVFSLATSPFLLFSYVVAAGRVHGEPADRSIRAMQGTRPKSGAA